MELQWKVWIKESMTVLTSELTFSSGTLWTIDTVAVDSGTFCFPFLLCILITKGKQTSKEQNFGEGKVQRTKTCSTKPPKITTKKSPPKKKKKWLKRAPLTNMLFQILENVGYWEKKKKRMKRPKKLSIKTLPKNSL